jgi:hypothetical protein
MECLDVDGIYTEFLPSGSELAIWIPAFAGMSGIHGRPQARLPMV